MSADAKAHIEFIGSREAIIEGCRGILEYDNEMIRLSLGRESVRFLGKNLTINAMADRSTVIEGNISSMEFVR